jgi:pimeloyl-ACP methyl ester carboxylesterase
MSVTKLLIVCVAALVLSASQVRAQESYKLHEGTIGGAQFAVAEPATWNGTLVLVAHGLRAADAPIVHGFNPDYKGYRYVIQDGWMIAATSYRRNGVIISDAVTDLDNLLGHVTKEFGTPKRVLVDGSSMGGIIGTLMAERSLKTYHGVLAKGAALGMSDSRTPFKLTYTPQLPLLFLSNQDEVAQVRRYAEKVDNDSIAPVVWKIERDGHVNINAREHEAALRALDRWVGTGEVERNAEATMPNPPAISKAVFRNGGAHGSVTEVTSDFGNINTDFIIADLEKIGIDRRDTFTVKSGSNSVSVVLGTDYGDVSRGEWVAFISWEGMLRIARNFDNAAEGLGCKTGDSISIMAIDR